MILDRLNGYFGYRAVAGLRIVQGPVHRHRTVRRVDRPEPEPLAASESQDQPRIKADSLRSALGRVGARVCR